MEETNTNVETNEIVAENKTLAEKIQINFPLFITMVAVVSIAVGLGIGFLVWGYEAPVQIAPVDIPEDAQRYVFDYLEGTPEFGDKEAAILMIEFTDFECVYCQKYNNEVFPLIEKNYKKDLLYVFIPYPLDTIHPNAMNASLASMCAQDQDAFWDYRSLAFSAEEGYSTDAFISYANQLNLDEEQFNTCLEEEPYLELLEENISRAMALGVTSTPTFLINGLPVMGAQPFELFAGIIEAEILAANQ